MNFGAFPSLLAAVTLETWADVSVGHDAYIPRMYFFRLVGHIALVGASISELIGLVQCTRLAGVVADPRQNLSVTFHMHV